MVQSVEVPQDPVSEVALQLSRSGVSGSKVLPGPALSVLILNNTWRH